MSQEVLIGAGGWGYFSGGLRTYAGAFQFAEANSTFYRLPEERNVARWRQVVPDSFKFSVKAPRQITHHGGKLDSPGAREHLGQAAAICDRLDAPWLVFEYPPWREFDSSSCAAIVDLISSVNLRATVCIEARAYSGRDIPTSLAKTMREIPAIDVVDPLVQDPRVPSEQAYLRVFGKGEHNIYQPTDEELEDADDRTSRGGFDFAVFAFHGVKMYKDAARFAAFKRTGIFPKVTKGEGLSSLDEVLKEDARFPSSREELIHQQGWKLVDLADTKRVRASVLLKQLDDRVYRSRAEVTASLSSLPPSKP